MLGAGDIFADGHKETFVGDRRVPKLECGDGYTTA